MKDSDIKISQREALEHFLMDIEILDEIDSKLAHFNVFETLGMIHTEIRHSNVLSWLLSPTENHGLGDYVLKKVIQSIVYQNYIDSANFAYSPLEISLLDYHDFVIRREWRDIDVVAVSEANQLVVTIENKVWSKESKHQLHKYRHIIQEEFPNYQHLFIFLTPYGDSASDEENWFSFDYNQFIKIIEKGINLKGDTISNRVKLFIDQYITMVRRYIVGDEELERICREIYYKHKKALDLIFEHKPDTYSDIANDLKELVTQEPGLILDTSPKTYIRFTTNELDDLIEKKGGGWTSSKRILLFEFQNKNNKLALKLIIGPGDQVLRRKIYDIAINNKSDFRGKIGKLMNQYTTIYTQEFLPKNFEDNYDYEDILKRIKTKFDAFLRSDVHNIQQTIIDNWNS
ncbi:PD-(D/E)XK nuclease family protein [Halobacillus sp. A5]|uniref:PDDEXK-like family protein n=1 Tax=Halobacillus sp. A5 TaxID=2880263 RepID=UPI0020A6B6A6|nr:PD-(D/E)XK nuclease family protein [Halobacillus sp. A5]MCP3027027.1 PD-(D/E)XK nuclease family protein [Halobacillus sp. A5]